jgi:RNA polymerase sigma-70 factor (ECF subfamily)
MTFLYRIAVNLSLNRIRDRKWHRFVRWEAYEHREGDMRNIKQLNNPEVQFEEKELQEMVRRAIESLPVNQKTAVLLRRYQGLSYEEIAEVMHCSVSAVEARLHRARQNLKKRLQQKKTI